MSGLKRDICGTEEGYLRHRSRKERICDECRRAVLSGTDYVKYVDRRERRRKISARARRWFEDILDQDYGVST